MDRNQRARDQFAAQQEITKMRQQFAAAVASGQAKVLDRFSVPIEAGSLVVWKCPQDWVWAVTDVKPMLDPRQAPGLVEITFTATVPAVCRVNSPIVEMIHVGKQGTGSESSQLTTVGTPAEEEEP